MRLKELKGQNFKGFDSIAIKPNFANISIYGDNETGKTTLFDMFLWLLFGKDSLNHPEFDIKPIDQKTGEVKHNLITEVTAIIEHEGTEHELKKAYYEKWTKNRKTKIDTLTGHTNDYWFDDAPMTETEYKRKISEFVDENVFKMVTNPLFVNEKMIWTDRRKLLIDICGDVDPDLIFQENPGLRVIEEEIKRMTFDKYRESLSEKRKALNKQVEDTQTRIDENNKSIADFADIDFEVLEATISDLEKEILKVDKDIVNAGTGTDIGAQSLAMARKETQLINLKNKANEKNNASIRSIKTKFEDLESENYELQKERARIGDRIVSKKRESEETKKTLDKLRTKWVEINESEFQEPKSPDNCPTCGKPWDKDEKKVQEARETFNFEKSESLAKISSEAKDIHKPLLAQQLKEIQDMQKKLAEKDDLYTLNSEELKKAGEKYEDARKKLFDIETDEEYIKGSKELEAMKANLKQQQDDIAPRIKQLEDGKAEVKTEIDRLKQELDKKYQPERAQKRIDELKAEMKDVSKQLDIIDEKMDLTDQYLTAQVNIMEMNIEKHFKIARFKMFDIQVNGALKPCCIAIHDGVSYWSMNNAARIINGLDIINTLVKHYNFNAPVFIDNAEAVTKYIDTDYQLIKLIVSEKDKKLRIEVE